MVVPVRERERHDGGGGAARQLRDRPYAMLIPAHAMGANVLGCVICIVHCPVQINHSFSWIVSFHRPTPFRNVNIGFVIPLINPIQDLSETPPHPEQPFRLSLLKPLMAAFTITFTKPCVG
jgi:hypothetical protein